MDEQIKQRVSELLQNGRDLMASRRRGHGEVPDYWVHEAIVAQAHAWVLSVANVISLVAPPGSTYTGQMSAICDDDDFRRGVSWSLVQKTQGVLTSISDEVERGLLRKLEYIVVATAFDDFLDHAAEFHRANKAREAGVLAAVVLEDTVKRTAEKWSIPTNGRSIEELVDLLVKSGALTPVKARRVKAYAGVRNPALHAEWDKFDIRDAGELIEGTRELIEVHL